MYDTGARVPRRLWYPVWETKRAFPPLDPKTSSILPRSKKSNRIHGGPCISIQTSILFVIDAKRRFSREREKKTFFSLRIQFSLSLSLSSNLATRGVGSLEKSRFQRFFIRDFIPRPPDRGLLSIVLNPVIRWRLGASWRARVSGHVHHEPVNPIVGWLLRQQFEEHQG